MVKIAHFLQCDALRESGNMGLYQSVQKCKIVSIQHDELGIRVVQFDEITLVRGTLFLGNHINRFVNT